MERLTGQWKGPDVLLTSGRGDACVFPQDAETPLWIPDRLIRHINANGDEQKTSLEKEEEFSNTLPDQFDPG